MSKDELERTTPLEECIAAIVAEIIRDKESKGVSPPYATTSEILGRLSPSCVKEALNSLVKSRLLTYHPTLNDIAFEFTPPK